MIKFKRLLKSFTYAFKGLYKVFKEEQNLKIQSFIALAVVAAGFIFNIKKTEWLIIILFIVLVILMEIVNSAVERVTDILKPRIHDYVKEIKDIMAAAVMVSSVAAAIIGLIIFWPYLFG
jgi:diacylglycerol kinase